MIKRNLLKTTILTTVIACILTSTACGKKSASNDIQETKATVSAETKSNAAKELTKTGLVTFDYTDEDGNTYTLEGKAVANESGDATIEVTDASGNKVTFTGRAKTVDGKLSVSDIAVKDAGTLVKADGTEIKVSTGTTVADANESTGNDNVSDIAASDDVKNEVETAKKEESVIEAAREEADNNSDRSDDTIIADNGNNGDSDNNDNGGNTDNNNTPAPNPEPTPSEPEAPVEKPAEPEPTPSEPVETPVEPEPTPEEPEKKAVPVECWPHLQLSNGYYGTQGELLECSEYLFPQYIDGTLSEADVKNMIMNGRLYDIYNWDADSNQLDTIPEAKMLSVEIRKWDKTQVQEMRRVIFDEWNHGIPGKTSGSYVRCDKNGNPYEWYAFLITYEMP